MTLKVRFQHDLIGRATANLGRTCRTARAAGTAAYHSSLLQSYHSAIGQFHSFPYAPMMVAQTKLVLSRKRTSGR